MKSATGGQWWAVRDAGSAGSVQCADFSHLLLFELCLLMLWEPAASSSLTVADQWSLREKKKLKAIPWKMIQMSFFLGCLLLIYILFFSAFSQRGKKSVWKGFWSQLKGPVSSSVQVKRFLSVERSAQQTYRSNRWAVSFTFHHLLFALSPFPSISLNNKKNLTCWIHWDGGNVKLNEKVGNSERAWPERWGSQS